MLDRSSYFDPGAAGGSNMPSWNGIGFGPPRAVPQVVVKSCTELKTWATGAPANALVGYDASSTRLREYVVALTEKGFVTPHFMRTGGTGVHVVQRTRTRILAGQL